MGGYDLQKPKIVAMEFPNPRFRQYHLSKEISTEHGIFTRPVSRYDETELRSIGDIGYNLVVGIMTIDGIEEVTIDSYYIGISIGQAFDWGDIETQVFGWLKTVFEKGAGIKIERRINLDMDEDERSSFNIHYIHKKVRISKRRLISWLEDSYRLRLATVFSRQ